MAASTQPRAQAVAAEALGTTLLLAIVVGSGIMGERLADGNAAVALLANSLATGAGLFVLIACFAPLSGAHFNPMVSLIGCWRGDLGGWQCIAYIAVQFAGAFAGVALAHAMFGLPLLQSSSHQRSTLGEGIGEAVATFGLILVILSTARFRPQLTAVAVACYITSAYWFTSSTSFANPAVTIARATTATFAGISADSVPGFLAGQWVGAVAATLLWRWLARTRSH